MERETSVGTGENMIIGHKPQIRCLSLRLQKNLLSLTEGRDTETPLPKRTMRDTKCYNEEMGKKE